MKVAVNLLHLVPGETGGAETYARRLLPALAEADPRLELTLYAGAAAAESLENERWNVVPLRFDPRSRVRRVLAEQTLLPAALRGDRLNLLHNLFNTGPAVSPVPQVTTIHDVVFKRYPETHGVLAKGVELLVPLAARRSARIVTVSEASKADIIQFLGIASDRIDVTPNGPGLSEGVKGPPPLEIRRRFEVGDAPLVLTVAPTRRHKNVDRLVEALARIPDAVLVVAGYQTSGEDDLVRYAERLGVANRLRRPGWVDDATLDGLYRAADCFAFPSLAEGFGLPVLEAMLRGAPVACSNTTSLPEIAGDAALFFDPLDVDAIADAVRQLLGDEKLATRLRKAGRKRAAGFSWDEAARLTLESYRKALT